MNWLKSTDDLQPGAYLWRLREGEPIEMIQLWKENEETSLWRFHTSRGSDGVLGSNPRGEWLPVASLLAHHADLERRLAAMEASYKAVVSVSKHHVDCACIPCVDKRMEKFVNRLLDDFRKKLDAIDLTPAAEPQVEAYNKNFGDDRKCECGHAYCRHFDTYDDMEPVGCKYCECRTFNEATGEIDPAAHASVPLLADPFEPRHTGYEPPPECEPADTPRCPYCGYTELDKQMHGDHHICDKAIEAENAALQAKLSQAWELVERWKLHNADAERVFSDGQRIAYGKCAAELRAVMEGK